MILPPEEAPEYIAPPQLRDFPEGNLVVLSEVFAVVLTVALVHDHCTGPRMYLLHLLVPPDLLLLDLLIGWSTKADLGAA
jgi:hypothetical protein